MEKHLTPPKYRIIHIITSLNIGGAEQALKRLNIAFPEDKYKIVIISLMEMGKIGIELQEKGFEVIALNISIVNLPARFLQLIKLINEYKPDVVQTWLYHADLIGGLAARFAGIRHIIWGVRTTELKKGAFLTIIVRKLNAWLSYIIPSKIVCVAEASKAKHLALGYCKKKMLVIPNGFDFDKLQKDGESSKQLRLSNGIAQDITIIGSIGRFSQIKGQDVFVRAAGIIARKYPNVKFLMVGRDLDASNDHLKKWIADTGYPERFVLLGERNDINVCFGAINIFCLHSRSEGFPNVLAEAMAMGLPSVAANVGDAEILGGGLISLAEPDNHESLAAALLQMLTLQPEKLNELGRLSQQRILNEYSILSMSQTYMNLYNNIIRKT